MAFQPPNPLTRTLYLCDSKFHTEEVKSLISDGSVYGFLIVDGNGALFGTLSDQSRKILFRMDVSLPGKTARGGQSAARFGRIRVEKRHVYLSQVCENLTRFFITDDRPNVAGLIVAGLAEFKTEIMKSNLLDQRLLPIVLKILDVSHGGEVGFLEAITLSQDVLRNTRISQEISVLQELYEEIAKGTDKYTYGKKSTLAAMKMGAVKRLILWENLEEPADGSDADATPELFSEDLDAPYIEKAQNGNSQNQGHVKGPSPVKNAPVHLLIDWVLENATRLYGCQISLVTDASSEGSQFVKGFGGIAALLRYPVSSDERSYDFGCEATENQTKEGKDGESREDDDFLDFYC